MVYELDSYKADPEKKVYELDSYEADQEKKVYELDSYEADPEKVYATRLIQKSKSLSHKENNNK